jgi:hypothetical protein
MKKTAVQRFKHNCRYDPETGCVLWMGPVAGKDRLYGVFWDGGRRVYAHRWIYEKVVGPIPEGYELDHICGHKNCVRPSHLEPVTHKENARRAAARGAWAGTRNGNAKLTDAQVLEIRRLAKLGVPVAKLSRRFGVNQRNVYYILKGKNWTHLKPAQPRRGGGGQR